LTADIKGCKILCEQVNKEIMYIENTRFSREGELKNEQLSKSSHSG
jgi:hypothetical protein